MFKKKIKKMAVAIMLGSMGITSAAGIGTANASPIQSFQDKVGTDKIAHFGAGYIIADLCDKSGISNAGQLGVVTGVAALKESMDDKWDTKDFIATVLGGITNIGLHGKF